MSVNKGGSVKTARKAVVAQSRSAALKLVAEWTVQQREGAETAVIDGWAPREGRILTVTRAISARVNQNFDGFPSEELRKSYKTFLGKPVFVNHMNEDPTRARGRVIGARYVENGADKYIQVIQEVDAQKFPVLAKELLESGLDSVSMGCSAERTICSYCHNVATGMFDMCEHVLNSKGRTLKRQAANGQMEDVLVYEECRDLGFFELSYVFDPADETAVVSNLVVANRIEASKGPMNRVYCDLPGCNNWAINGSDRFKDEWISGGGDLRPHDYCCDDHRAQYEKQYPDWEIEGTINNPVKLNAALNKRAWGEIEAPEAADVRYASYHDDELSQRQQEVRNAGRDVSGLREGATQGPEELSSSGTVRQLLSEGEASRSSGGHRASGQAPARTEDAERGAGRYAADQSGRVRRGEDRPGAREPGQEQLGLGTQARHGADAGTQVAARRERASQESRPGGQQAGESGAVGNRASRRSATGGPDPVRGDDASRRSAGSSRLSWGEKEAPESVDTLRDENEDLQEEFHQYVQSPPGLAMPDLDKARELERRNEVGEGYEDFSDYLQDEVQDGASLDENALDDANAVGEAVDSLEDEESGDVAEFPATPGPDGNPFDDDEPVDDVMVDPGDPAVDEETEDGIPEDVMAEPGDPEPEVVPEKNDEEPTPPSPPAKKDDTASDEVSPPAPPKEDKENDEPVSPEKKRTAPSSSEDDDNQDSADSADMVDDEASGLADQLGIPEEELLALDPEDLIQLLDAVGSDEEKKMPNKSSSRRREVIARASQDFLNWVSRSTTDPLSGMSQDSLDDLVDDFLAQSPGLYSDEDIATIQDGLSQYASRKQAFNVGDKVIDTAWGGLLDGTPGTVTAVDGDQVTVQWDGAAAETHPASELKLARTKENMKGSTMSTNSLAQRGRVASRNRVADDSRNDQGEMEDTFITETPPAEPVETGEGEKINNTEENLVASIRRQQAQLAKVRRAKAARRRKQADDSLGVPGEETPEVVDPPLSGTDEQDLKGDFESADPNDGVEETQPKDAARRAARLSRVRSRRFARWVKAKHGKELKEANSVGELRTWVNAFCREAKIRPEVMYPVVRPQVMALRKKKASDDDEGVSGDKADIPEFIQDKIDGDDDKKESRKQSRKRKVADEKLDVAAPDGRVDVERPTAGDTDDEAQASQFDKGDFGNNAGDDLADPDLSTDQNWAPGEGKQSSWKAASGVNAVRLARAYIDAGLEDSSQEWVLASQFEKMSATVVNDRLALLERVVEANRTAARKTAGTRGATSRAIPQGLSTSRPAASSVRTAGIDSSTDSDLFL